MWQNFGTLVLLKILIQNHQLTSDQLQRHVFRQSNRLRIITKMLIFSFYTYQDFKRQKHQFFSRCNSAILWKRFLRNLLVKQQHLVFRIRIKSPRKPIKTLRIFFCRFPSLSSGKEL